MSFYEFKTITMGLIFGLIMSAPLWLLMVNNSTITIEKSYQYELTQCELKLSQCVESKTPSCSPCECKQGVGYWVFLSLSLLIYLGTLVWNNKKITELNEREQDIIKKEKEILSNNDRGKESQ